MHILLHKNIYFRNTCFLLLSSSGAMKYVIHEYFSLFFEWLAFHYTLLCILLKLFPNDVVNPRKFDKVFCVAHKNGSCSRISFIRSQKFQVAK